MRQFDNFPRILVAVTTHKRKAPCLYLQNLIICWQTLSHLESQSSGAGKLTHMVVVVWSLLVWICHIRLLEAKTFPVLCPH
jgi:hypothetical protein